MKNVKLHLVGAFVMGLGVVFAGQAFKTPDTVFYRANPNPLAPDKCIPQSECTSPTGANCDFRVFESDGEEGCSAEVNLKKNTP